MLNLQNLECVMSRTAAGDKKTYQFKRVTNCTESISTSWEIKIERIEFQDQSTSTHFRLI